MQSKWFKLKPEAVKLRKTGQSLPSIHKKLGIPKSTLSYWFKDITLTTSQKTKLHKNWQNALGKARVEAVKWHNSQKTERLATAKREALQTIDHINLEDTATMELALAVLYLAEGSKKNIETALGSSDPETLRFFITSLRKIYSLQTSSIRCELSLRFDQEPEKLKRYWAKELALPLSCFKQANLDKRTEGKKTYTYYKGVCNVRVGNVAIRRRLVYLAEEYFAIINRQNNLRA